MINNTIPGIVVSGLRGGSGKTVLSLALAASIKDKGLSVTPFKKGPDYIDAGWLAKVTGTACYNLDLFMMTPEQAFQSYIDHTVYSDFAIIEGNRGLYDGMDHHGTYSTAELSKLLGLPVIIVVDCSKVTGTVAAMVLGCQKMDPEVMIAGVVLNRVATARQEGVIRKALTEKCGLPVLGVIPRLKKDPFPERHMGLTPFHEHEDIAESVRMIGELGRDYLDLDAILDITATVSRDRQGNISVGENTEARRHGDTEKTELKDRPRIGVIRDSAFQFYYEENFEELRGSGAEIVEISPLKGGGLSGLDALYIGGGFPETHAIALTENTEFRNALNKAIQGGLPVYAECGGLMYLGKELVLQNKTYPMVGVLPLTFGLEKRPAAHGYTMVEVENDNPYYQKGTVLRGHEFHYSRVLDIGEGDISMAFKVKRGRGIVDNMDGVCYKNVLASYTHLHAIGSPEWAEGLVRCALRYREGREENG